MVTSHDTSKTPDTLFKASEALDGCLMVFAAAGVPLCDVQAAVRRMYVLNAMHLNGNRVGKAARHVGIHRNTMPRILNGRGKNDARTQRGTRIQTICADGAGA